MPHGTGVESISRSPSTPVSVGVADPVPLTGEPGQHRDRQAQQPGVAQQQRAAYSPSSDHAIGHEDVKCGQKGV